MPRFRMTRSDERVGLARAYSHEKLEKKILLQGRKSTGSRHHALQSEVLLSLSVPTIVKLKTSHVSLGPSPSLLCSHVSQQNPS